MTTHDLAPWAASAGLQRSPWSETEINRLIAILAVALVGIVAAWFGCSGATTWTPQMRWMVLGIGATTLGGAGGVGFVIAGLRATRAERRAVVLSLREIQQVSPYSDDPGTAAPGHELVTGNGMSHYHRSQCLLARDKDVVVLEPREIGASHLIACEVCEP